MVLMKSNEELQKEDTAPSFSLKDTKNIHHDLDGYDKKLTLIVFICNHCPYVLPKIEELKRIQKDFKDLLDVVAINSNNHPDYVEDDFEHMHLFSKDKKLIWKGRIDDGGMNTGKTPKLCAAIKEFLEKGKISMQENPSMGCSIKWN